ncbi:MULTISPECIES: type II secretion system protein [unclassified Herbaspirillum]|uniref:type II secretion system protein n=1 Tax=unclassified Herbaspirillum TaxID=2624150 RepID=UPI001169C617|nr:MULTISPECIES: type II secretion system protein [unclassified Herbaspirillum]MBB5390553.1 type II secretory pathway pseudopilin PulG [Herbaspirillum sp. SJZ102]TQK08959.1 type II secretory pathway pseudopilin PulG [Herbaspirillum sp. SJZ130]TQK14354.1 type II secretory pathway pseudopilin PulG [Herbaspirillum sp. SJZ106]TWC66629.1 type II secretory pathway pseudopilin PulG [Herbaspirillum sp. SJZ099]
MRHGKARREQAGIAYIGVLLLISAIGFVSAQAATVRSTMLQREKEAQLLFVGEQFRAAIESYFQSGSGGRYPLSLDDLVEDNRQIKPIRHLRRIYPDPISGSADWGIIRSADGGVMGVFSKTDRKPFKRQNFPEGYAAFNDAKSYSDWIFVYKQRVDPSGAAGNHPPTVMPSQR